MALDPGTAIKWVVGLILVGVGVGIFAGFWWTGAGLIVGLIFVAGGLLLMGYDRLAIWLENLFDRDK